MSVNAYAGKTTYTEDDFLRSFSGKSNTIVLEKLGNPDMKELSVKPTGANTMLAGKVRSHQNQLMLRCGITMAALITHQAKPINLLS